VKKVLVATPTYDGKLDAWYVDSLVNTIIEGSQKEIIFKPVFLSYDALVQRARNDLIAAAVEFDFDDILWIDADMQWDPEWAIRLVEREEDVVGGTVIKKSITEESYNVRITKENLDLKENGLIEVESVGTGFLKMSKKAYKYLWDNSPSYISYEKERRLVFNVALENEQLVSEDYYVCKKLKEGGFKVYIDPTITCPHIGSLKYVGNFEDYLKRIKESEV
jgi:glycosyltransferase involved in cell wall biosynthesis